MLHDEELSALFLYQETSFGGKINNSADRPTISHSKLPEVWVSDTLRAELALDALEMAIWSRGDRMDGKLVHHSDRGVQ
jgi:hypothetical protein